MRPYTDYDVPNVYYDINVDIDRVDTGGQVFYLLQVRLSADVERSLLLCHSLLTWDLIRLVRLDT